jgi:hypothetical protein
VKPAAGARALGAAALLGLAALAPARGQTPACGTATGGELSVQADVQCECRFFLESRFEATPAGWRWDCGILRPRLNYTVPVDLNAYPYALPEGLSLELPTSLDPRPPPPKHR